jgi:signal transduction histidine kinase
VADPNPEPHVAFSLGQAHARFARAALLIYLGAATISVLALMVAAITDRAYDESQTREHLLLDTQVRAQSLEQHLTLLVAELGRLGVRSEIDLLDENVAPERRLLELSHRDSAFFNQGVAIVDGSGRVVWAEPTSFVTRSRGFGEEPWFRETARTLSPQIVPIRPEVSTNASVWLVAPIVRTNGFAGALVGGIDLGRGQPLGTRSAQPADTVLATSRGVVVFPPAPPAYATQSAWLHLFTSAIVRAFAVDAELDGAPTVVAGCPVTPGGFVLLSVAPRARLLEPARRRMVTRISIGLSLALTPLAALVLLLRRSWRVFWRAEAEAVREDRIRMIGEAASHIAHEIRNSINGLKVGLDLVLGGQPASNLRVVRELRAEIDRLSSFTHQLMLFARDPTPRRAAVDLAEFVPIALSLTAEVAAELGVELELTGLERPLLVDADAGLLRIVLTNLVSNALDALATLPPGTDPPMIRVDLGRADTTAELRVSDNGPGVPAEVEHRLFEPFVTGKPSGVGIGLALARKIARAHGGDLVHGQALGGASFLLTLPLMLPPHADKEPRGGPTA